MLARKIIMKQKIKTAGIWAILILIVVGLIVVYFRHQNWTIRFRSELDDFFGEGNWVYISEETKQSIIYSDYHHSHSNPTLSGNVPGKYKDWYISFENRIGEEESECMRVTISYGGGNPKPKFYDKLAKEPWFTVNEVSAEDFLAYDEHAAFDMYFDKEHSIEYGL